MSQKEKIMSGNIRNPDLKTLIARDELKSFIVQLDAILPISLTILDNYGAVLYENGSMEDGKRIVGLTANSCPYPIKINDSQIGVIAGFQSSQVSRSKLIESVRYAGEMLTDRLAHELKVDSLASEIINSYQELNLFYEIGSSLSSVLDRERICQVVLQQAVSIIGSKRAFMMLLDAGKEELIMVELSNLDESLKGMRLPVKGSIYEVVIRNRKPLVIEDIERYPNLKSKIDEENMMFTVPLICVPVSAESEVFGVIGMSEKVSGEPFTSVDTKLLGAMASQAGMSLGNAHLHDDLREIFLNTVEALAAAVEAKDPYMHGHCRRVAEYCMSIGEEMGLPGKEISDLRLAGILHDIGKIGISESILRKPEGLTSEQVSELRSHPVKGAEIIEHIEQMGDIALWIRHHHERYDGKGYPDGLSGHNVPLHSRIVAVADAYDTVALNRNHATRHPYDAAVTTLQVGSGSQFDPEIIDVFLSIVREDAYEKYLEEYRRYDDTSGNMLNRVSYYRVENEITNILARVAVGNDLSELEQMKLKELRELALR